MIRDYCQIAKEYAEKVVAGEIIACKWVQLACQRQLNDLERDFKYYFDTAAAARVCIFIELLPHIKGEWAGTNITLEPWQIFILTTVFGWLDENGYRRFKTVYTEIPRKNAKSTLSSGVALYCLSADGEAGAEVYSAATTRDQARIVWSDAKQMASRCKGLRRRFGVGISANAVYVEKTASTFKALSRDQGGNLDGLNVHCGVIDELHAHKTREVFDVIETGTGARRQPLLWLITTAGFNRSGICYEQRTYITKVLAGQLDDEYFGIIYSLDDEDDWTDPKNWEKANPNWGLSVNPDDIARKARKAMSMSSAQNNFLTKHLNVWVNADTAWLDMVSWQSCGNDDLDMNDFKGRRCYAAIDLATKIDIASVAFYFPATNDEEKDALFVKNYLPEDRIEDSTNSQYEGWAKDGRLTATPGNVTDFAYIEDDFRDAVRNFDIQEVAYDPWQATYLATRLMEEGLPMIEFRQLVKDMSESMKELEARIISDRLEHENCPVLTWMFSNVVAHVDAKENIYPRKEQPENKIDGVVATIMALARAMVYEDSNSVYETEELLIL